MGRDRSNYPVRKLRLGQEEEPGRDLAHLDPGQRMAMVWQLTLQAWAFKDPSFRESRLPRHVVRVVRGRGSARRSSI